MGTQQHFVLFEHATGFGLFRVKEFDELTRKFTAHVNAFIKPIAFVPFNSVTEAVENVQAVANGLITNLLRQFLRTNLPPRNAQLGVCDESLGKSILACEFGFGCVWHGAIREILRIIRQNFARLTRSLITQPGNAFSLTKQLTALRSGDETLVPARVAEARARLVVGLACTRMRLNFNQHLVDTTVIRALTLIDELDTNLTRSASRLRASYASHFPEVCHPSYQNNVCLNDIDLIRLISRLPARCEIIDSDSAELQCLLTDKSSPVLQATARDSVGCELADVDAENIKLFAQHLLKMIEMRKHNVQLLSKRIESVVPNLNALLKTALPDDQTDTDETGPNTLRYADSVSAPLLAARLIVNAGSVTRLGNMPTSRILSLGASKSLFRRSGAVAATATGLLGSTSRQRTSSSMIIGTTKEKQCLLGPAQLRAMSGNRITPDIIRRRAARLLAAKTALACRADCFRAHNPATVTATEQIDIPVEEDTRLTMGQFGAELGQNMKHQLRVWAETNGVHVERTQVQIKEQRERRKKYRKKKRKAWLNRKLSKTASGLQQSSTSLNLINTLMIGHKSLPTDDEQSSSSANRDMMMDVDTDISETICEEPVQVVSDDHAKSKQVKPMPVHRRSTRICSKQLTSTKV